MYAKVNKFLKVLIKSYVTLRWCKSLVLEYPSRSTKTTQAEREVGAEKVDLRRGCWVGGMMADDAEGDVDAVVAGDGAEVPFTPAVEAAAAAAPSFSIMSSCALCSTPLASFATACCFGGRD